VKMDWLERFACSNSERRCRTRRRPSGSLLIVCLTLAVSVSIAVVPARAQTFWSPQFVVVQRGVPTAVTAEGPPGQVAADAITFGPMNAGPVVKNAPYSADATTEVIQTLADGSRIVRRTSASVYRDSRGRVRREVALTEVAGIVIAGDPLHIITITDPDSRMSYAFTPDKRLMQMTGPGTAPPDPLSLAASAQPFGATVQPQTTQPAGTVAREEELGTRTIEGLRCQGTRSTTTIPAGAIGNERPIATITERWFSPELQIIVLSRVSDPRYGETTYRLAKITRAEPDASLFNIPR
jgi:hypothetical protein